MVLLIEGTVRVGAVRETTPETGVPQVHIEIPGGVFPNGELSPDSNVLQLRLDHFTKQTGRGSATGQYVLPFKAVGISRLGQQFLGLGQIPFGGLDALLAVGPGIPRSYRAAGHLAQVAVVGL